MAIPDFQTIMLPLLKFSSDKKEHSLREAIEFLADGFKLAEEERKEADEKLKEILKSLGIE